MLCLKAEAQARYDEEQRRKAEALEEEIKRKMSLEAEKERWKVDEARFTFEYVIFHSFVDVPLKIFVCVMSFQCCRGGCEAAKGVP